jgi:hypothetical protein
MLNARLYRAALVPVVIALAIASFSLGPRPHPRASTLAPDAFQGPRALAELQRLAASYPQRRPGSEGDERLAEQIAGTLRGLGATAGGGFSVRVEHSEGQTIDGKRPLTTVIAERPGSTNATPIVIVAHRDAAARGSTAELSGTAALLELARVFAARETKRTIVLASTSGGSGGAAGAAALSRPLAAGAAHGGVDAAIVIGDLAGATTRRPIVLPFSDGYGLAPLQLQRTVADAVRHESGSDPGAPSVLGQLAHLMLPLTVGEQGVLDAEGVPSVMVQGSGERGPSPRDAVAVERLEGLGRGVLSAVDALDVAPDVAPAMQTGLVLQRKLLPGWVAGRCGRSLARSRSCSARCSPSCSAASASLRRLRACSCSRTRCPWTGPLSPCSRSSRSHSCSRGWPGPRCCAAAAGTCARIPTWRACRCCWCSAP